ncbi:hypothetical protein F5887DRAFT_914704 [Amanita rubescens]|nr:hypothetical protein F5887DRAFT_914704 [Amanita rubescens]
MHLWSDIIRHIPTHLTYSDEFPCIGSKQIEADQKWPEADRKWIEGGLMDSICYTVNGVLLVEPGRRPAYTYPNIWGAGAGAGGAVHHMLGVLLLVVLRVEGGPLHSSAALSGVLGVELYSVFLVLPELKMMEWEVMKSQGIQRVHRQSFSM